MKARPKESSAEYPYRYPDSHLNLYDLLKLIHEKSKKSFLTFQKVKEMKFIF